MLFERKGELVILRLEGEVAFHNCRMMKEDLHRTLQEDDCYFIVDVSRVEFMDSGGLGMLVSLLKMACDRGGNLVLAAPQEGIERLFHMTRLDRVFRIYSTVEEAEKAIESEV